MDRNRKIALIECLILVGFVVSLCFHYEVNGWSNGTYPFNTFLYRFNNQFMDLFEPLNEASSPYTNGNTNAYFPLVFILLNVLFVAPRFSPLVILLLFLGSFLVGFLAICQKYLRDTDVAVTVRRSVIFSFCTWPFLFALDRANVEVWCFLLTGVFVIAIEAKRNWLANLALAVSLAFKPFGAVFLAIYIARKSWKDLAATVVIAAGLILMSYMYYGVNLLQTVRGNAAGYAHATSYYVLDFNGMPFSTSLFTLVKLCRFAICHNYDRAPIAILLHWYSIAMVIGGVVWLGYIFKSKLPLWNIFAQCAIIADIVPTVAFGYRLINITLAILLFVSAKTQTKYDRLLCIFFALAVIPFRYMHFPPYPEVSEQEPISIVSMMILMVLLIAAGNTRAAEQPEVAERAAEADKSLLEAVTD